MPGVKDGENGPRGIWEELKKKNGNREDPCGDGIILYLDYINNNILVVIILSIVEYYNFARCYRGNVWAKDTLAMSVLFFTTNDM